jgi:hypothetical protein
MVSVMPVDVTIRRFASIALAVPANTSTGDIEEKLKPKAALVHERNKIARICATKKSLLPLIVKPPLVRNWISHRRRRPDKQYNLAH